MVISGLQFSCTLGPAPDVVERLAQEIKATLRTTCVDITPSDGLPSQRALAEPIRITYTGRRKHDGEKTTYITSRVQVVSGAPIKRGVQESPYTTNNIFWGLLSNGKNPAYTIVADETVLTKREVEMFYDVAERDVHGIIGVCDHKHRTLRGAVKCGLRGVLDNWIVRAVENGEERPLTECETDELHDMGVQECDHCGALITSGEKCEECGVILCDNCACEPGPDANIYECGECGKLVCSGCVTWDNNNPFNPWCGACHQEMALV